MRFLTMIALAGGLCSGQAAEECKPSSLNIPGAKYPCVYPGWPRDVPRGGARGAEGTGPGRARTSTW